ARFGVPAAKLGIVFPANYASLLVSIAGITMAKKLLYTGDSIGAEEAHGAGIVSLCGHADPVKEARVLLDRIAGNAPLSLTAAKLACNAAAEGRIDSVMDKISDLSAIAAASKDIVEGARAFLEKRPPHFKGR